MRFIFLYALLFVAAACGVVASDALLFDAPWRLERLDGMAVDSTGARAFILLRSGDAPTVSGNTGCNALSGTFTLSKDRLTFSEMVTTRRGCFGEHVEPAFLDALNRVARYRIVEGQLIFTDGSVEVAVFRRQEPQSVSNGRHD